MTSLNITVGCQMNVSDSEKLSSSLVKMGFESQIHTKIHLLLLLIHALFVSQLKTQQQVF